MAGPGGAAGSTPCPTEVMRPGHRLLYILAHLPPRRRPPLAGASPSPARMPQLITSRSFTDTVGVEWTVREIDSPSLTHTLAKMLEKDRRRGGWLVFESSEGDKRRLAPYPPDWRTVSTFELERWCMKATRVPPAPARRAED